MTRISDFSTDEFYHIYNRGTDKRNIFKTSRDYERFLALLYLCNQDKPVDLKRQGPTLSEILAQQRDETLVSLVSYCLMPNHFHLLLQCREPLGVSKYVQKVNTGYTMYFNNRHDRSGVLFQGKFKSTHVHDDRYLKYLITYIHLNPVKLIDPEWKENGIRDRTAAECYLKNFRYSSYLDHIDKTRIETPIIDREKLRGYMATVSDFKEHVREWLDKRTD